MKSCGSTQKEKTSNAVSVAFVPLRFVFFVFSVCGDKIVNNIRFVDFTIILIILFLLIHIRLRCLFLSYYFTLLLRYKEKADC